MNINTQGKGKKWKNYVPPDNDFGSWALSEVGTTLDMEEEGHFTAFPGTMVLFREWQYSREDLIKYIRGTSQKILIDREDMLFENITVHWIGPQYLEFRRMLTATHWTTKMTDNTIIKEEETYAYARQYFIQAIFWTPASFDMLRRSIGDGEHPRFREWYDLPVDFIKANPQVTKLQIHRRVPGYSHTVEYLIKNYLKIKTDDYEEL